MRALSKSATYVTTVWPTSSGHCSAPIQRSETRRARRLPKCFCFCEPNCRGRILRRKPRRLACAVVPACFGRGNGWGLRPAEGVFVASPAITTLSRATGEAAVFARSLGERCEIARSSNNEVANLRRRRRGGCWASLFLVLRPGASPGPIASAQPAAPENAVRVAPSVAPSAPVNVRVSSSPAGATVVDGKDGSVLGQTPFEKYYPESKGVLEVVLRLAGYQDNRFRSALERVRPHP